MEGVTRRAKWRALRELEQLRLDPSVESAQRSPKITVQLESLLHRCSKPVLRIYSMILETCCTCLLIRF